MSGSSHNFWGTVSFILVSSIAHVEERFEGNVVVVNVSGSSHIYLDTVSFILVSSIAHVEERVAGNAVRFKRASLNHFIFGIIHLNEFVYQ